MNSVNVTAQAVSPFPAPPDYAQHYTSDRIAQGAVLPPPPVQSEFTVFGEDYNLDDEIIRSLTSQNIKQLYSSKNDWKSEMKKLNRSAVVAFLDLLDILIRCPDNAERTEKLNDIQTILINMHHLINEYRPLQARDTMRLMQREQLRELQETVKMFRDHLEAGRDALREELALNNLQISPAPRPAPITGIEIDSDSEGVTPALQKTADIPVCAEQFTVSSTSRARSKPSRGQLKNRRKAEFDMINSDDDV